MGGGFAVNARAASISDLEEAHPHSHCSSSNFPACQMEKSFSPSLSGPTYQVKESGLHSLPGATCQEEESSPPSLSGPTCWLKESGPVC